MNAGEAEEIGGAAAEDLLGELVPMPEATLLAHIAASGIDRTITSLHRNDMAYTLARLLTLFSVSEDRRRIRRLAFADLRNAYFTDNGAVLRFKDGRPPVTGIAVTRSALKAAAAALSGARRS